MLNIGNSLQEGKVSLISHSNHPKSAPIKNESDCVDDSNQYSSFITKIYQGEDFLKQKKLKQAAYFQELTRQVQEKNNLKSVKRPSDSDFPNEKSFKKSETLNFANEIPQDLFKDNEIKYSRYQKKYEIENHTKINVNTSQVFGGVLQRDEAFLNKIKKMQQQQEMKETLNSQMREKEKKKIEEKNRIRNMELNELRESFNQEKVENGVKEKIDLEIPAENIDVCESVRENKENGIEKQGKSSTMPISGFKIEDFGDKKQTLSEFFQSLTKETEDLISVFTEKEKQIKELEKKIEEKQFFEKTQHLNENFHAKFEKGKNQPNQVKNDSNNVIKTEKNKTKSSEISNQNKNALLHNSDSKKITRPDKNKLSVIDEKIENARKRRIENSKIKNSAKPVKNYEIAQKNLEFQSKNSELSEKKNEFLLKNIELSIKNSENSTKISEKFAKAGKHLSREKKIFSPVPQTPETEFDLVPIVKNEELDRHNLDTAGKSCFIYPDSQGNFKISDEIDKFVNDYERKSSPLVILKSSNQQSGDYDTRFSLSTMTFTGRKAAKPLVANKFADIFKVPI